MDIYVWKNISWNTDYNEEWYYNNDTAHLNKCFSDVFNLEFVLNTAGGGFEAYLENNTTPVLKLKGGASVTIKGFGSSVKLRMRRSGSDNSGMQEVSITTSGYVNLNGTGDGQLFFFGEIGIATMEAFRAYLFKGETLDNLNKTEPYLKNTVEIVKGEAKSLGNQTFSDTGELLAYDLVSKSYISSITNKTVYKDVLNKIGVNKIVIPRYKISEGNDEYHFEGLSFPDNRIEMTDEEKITGQFCHDGDLVLSVGNQLDAKYWSTTPHIYPELIITNMMGESVDEFNIILNKESLVVNNISYVLGPQDVVVLYERAPGTITPNTSLPDYTYSCRNAMPLQRRYLDKLTLTSALNFSPIVCKEITENIKIDSKQYVTDNLTKFPSIEESYEGKITFKLGGVSDTMYYKGWFLSSWDGSFQFGDWDGTSKPTWKSHVSVTNTCAVKIPYILNKQTTDITSIIQFKINYDTNKTGQLLDNGDVHCYLSSYGDGDTPEGQVTASYLCTGKLVGYFTSAPGTLPLNIPFFSTETCKYYSSKGGYYNVARYINNTYESRESFEENMDANTGWTHCLRLDMRWINYSDTNTYAHAIVVWRNGKLIKNSNGSESAGGGSGA